MNKKYYIIVIIRYKTMISLAVMTVSTKNKKEGINLCSSNQSVLQLEGSIGKTGGICCCPMTFGC